MKKNLYVLSIFLSLVFTSCLDKDMEAINEQQLMNIFTEAMSTTASDEAVTMAETYLNDYFSATAQSVSGMSKAHSVETYPIITLISEKGIYPESYIIDFGNGEFTDNNNRVITGMIYFSRSDISGSQKDYSFSKFYSNGINIKSHRKINRSKDGILTVNANDTITYNNGSSIIRNWERVRTLIDSDGDVSHYWNNSYSFEGSTSGKTLNGKLYKLDIRKPLISVAGYKYYVSGEVKLHTDIGEEFIDFGDGEQDNMVTVKLNGKTKIKYLNW